MEPPPAGRQASTSTFVTRLSGLVAECTRGHEVPIVAVAIAWPGRINPELNDVRGEPHVFPQKSGGWKSASLVQLVREALQRGGLDGEPPIYVINDADANLLALLHPTRADCEESEALREVHERLVKSSVALGMTIAGGVGGSLSLDRRAGGARRTIERGAHGFAGELGMIPVDVNHPEAERPTGAQGRVPRGIRRLRDLQRDESFPYWGRFLVFPNTLDHYASGRSIVDQLATFSEIAEGYNPVIDEIEFGDLADARVQHVMNRSGRLIGQALAGPILTLDPDLIVVSSFAASEHLVQGIWQNLETWGIYIGLGSDDIVMAPDDPARTTKGAARWAIEQEVAPVVEEVCSASNYDVPKLLEKLHRNAAFPARA